MTLLLFLKFYLKKLLFLFLLNIINFFFIINFSFSSTQEDSNTFFKEGIAIYKKANCSSCHFWHADGGNSHGGAAASLRSTNLSHKELLSVIKCGRPGTNMPYFYRYSKKDLDCKYLDNLDKVVLRGARLLNENEIKSLTKFIYDEIKSKPITKKYCLEFFTTKDACNKYNN